MDNSRKYNIILITLFAAIIAGVPLTQIAIEMKRDGRAQFTDLFRYAPSSGNLRAFESDLENKSVFQQTLRPAYQKFLFSALNDAGSNGMIGQDGWFFYRPGVRYLIEPDQVEAGDANSTWVEPSDGTTTRDSVVRAIVQFRDQLKERNIELLVMPVPGKASVYPDKLTRGAENRHQQFRSPTLELLRELEQNGVASIDLFTTFQTLRKEHPLLPSDKAYYLKRDTHWAPQAVNVAAQITAEKIKSMGVEPDVSRSFDVRKVSVRRNGDILEMMGIPGARDAFPAQTIECEQVFHKTFGPMLDENSPRAGTYMNMVRPDTSTSVLVLGDSFCRIYQLPEPQSLGESPDAVGKDEADGSGDDSGRTKRLLPGSAGFPSHLALAMGTTVDYIVSDGGAATDVRRQLSTNAEILEGKKIVIWEFVERDIALGAKGWQDVPRPPKMPGM